MAAEPSGHLPIIVLGGGIGGLAVACALQQLDIPVRVFERDPTFASRPQGYSLTIQQGLKVLDKLGLGTELRRLPARCTRSATMTSSGKILHGSLQKHRTEGWIPIPRQELRSLLLGKLQADTVQWDKQCVALEEDETGVTASFQDGTLVRGCALVACDGLRSTVRQKYFPQPLNYLGVMAILGIVPSKHDITHDCVFQTLDGSARFFSKPFAAGVSMWQLTFPWPEERLHEFPTTELMQAEASRRVAGWHDPIPTMVAETPLSAFRAGGVFDRDFPLPWKAGRVTILGDAAHPMSPFKGQGANQALEDAWKLAMALQRYGLRDIVKAFADYEADMLVRARPKAMASRSAVKFLHTPQAVDAGQQRTYHEQQVKIQHHEVDIARREQEATSVEQRPLLPTRRDQSQTPHKTVQHMLEDSCDGI
eukprot:TRINITY_DN3687_c0_g1_i1.p1 TRINITY_DN3687_c0_g1~~TRINITY_DN3687_c0_g1_i1.p1  ORF type:complete len:423 (+),score=78.97 TRINITY_DN3687_c0_g1_i1:24-1292(+)